MPNTDNRPCPRCSGPLDRHPALSRADDKTAICSPCGTHEAIQAFKRKTVTPRMEWPIVIAATSNDKCRNESCDLQALVFTRGYCSDTCMTTDASR